MTEGAGSYPESVAAASDRLRSLQVMVDQHANMGLPVGPTERFRLGKRLLARLCWFFLRHQVAFNEAIVKAVQEMSAQVTELERRVKVELLEFADRSASQAQAEINDEIAAARRAHADLLLELRTLQAELTAAREAVTGDGGGVADSA